MSIVSSSPPVLLADWAQLVFLLVSCGRHLGVEPSDGFLTHTAGLGAACQLGSQLKVLPGHPHMASTCALGFLLAWQLGAKYNTMS